LVLLSVVLCTIRSQPHFDWYISSLGRQTFKDFELVIVDDHSSQDRYLEVLKLCAKYGIRLGYYGVSKPTIWRGKRPALCNARNTAFIVANGQWLVFMDDNGYAHPEWLAHHLKWASFGLMSAGTWCTFQNGEPSETPIEMEAITSGKPTGEKLQFYYKGQQAPYGFEFRWEQRHKGQTVPCVPNWLHGGNMAFSMEAALAVNGFDEQYDGEQGVDDCDFGIRIRRAGFKMVFDPECVVYYNITSHHLTQNEVVEVKPDKATIPREKSARKPKEKMLYDGKMHFSNEKLIQDLNDDLSRIRVNPLFDLKKLREQYRTKFTMEHPLPEPVDWRDGARIADME
jgi:glycosyltransferase involved in cell wall biosynthesis